MEPDVSAGRLRWRTVGLPDDRAGGAGGRRARRTERPETNGLIAFERERPAGDHTQADI